MGDIPWGQTLTYFDPLCEAQRQRAVLTNAERASLPRVLVNFGKIQETIFFVTCARDMHTPPFETGPRAYSPIRTNIASESLRN